MQSYDGIILNPGRVTTINPNDVGICNDIIKYNFKDIPMLDVYLGLNY